MDRTWFEIKRTARQIANERRDFKIEEARSIVSRLLHDSLIEAPAEALDFLSREMVALVKEFESAGAGDRSA